MVLPLINVADKDLRAGVKLDCYRADPASAWCLTTMSVIYGVSCTIVLCTIHTASLEACGGKYAHEAMVIKLLFSRMEDIDSTLLADSQILVGIVLATSFG